MKKILYLIGSVVWFFVMLSIDLVKVLPLYRMEEYTYDTTYAPIFWGLMVVSIIPLIMFIISCIKKKK